ncbi:uncharacterized protein TrAtP1_009392 [Trichoderma atroviride]|uniref:uncharacterized protein n=1 Tax=Hypocrea atroviridis TaxID=63577 RepID=UPI0033230F0C|nr:hypothetical protein TrAtP1_009392 [Trichoderma atroviride]
MMPSFKKGFRPFKNWLNKRGSSNEADDCTQDFERENDAAHMEQREDQNPLSVTIEPPGEQQAITEQVHSLLFDPEPSFAAVVQPEIAEASITPPERIWNEAYDSLKAEEPKLVQAYEKILSSKLNGDSAVSMDQVSEKNVIQEENVAIRRAQMYQLIDKGLNKTRHEANIKGNISTAMQVVNATKKMIGDTIKDVPQAALPWAIVCVSLEILGNPISQTDANRAAVKYIGDTIKWYWEHATRLFGKDHAENHMEGFQRELQTAFVDFYKKLLQFQMKSICDYYRHRGSVFLRDIVKLDDWDGSLRSIREDDESLRDKVNGFLGYKIESHLKGLTLEAKAHDKYQRTREDQQCLRDLFITDPRDDKARIEETKGGLFEDSYRWIFENPKYQEWLNNDQNRLLWLSGDPGKGKTMLLCGIVQELMQQPDPPLVTFFFCQATILNNNDYVSVLRSLIWLLADQQPSLISYIRRSYDNTGEALFDGANAWYKLSQIFSNMLCDGNLPSVYIIIDALDECTTGRTECLHLVQKLSILPKVKLLVSSRNWPEIGGKLINEMNLSLEVNAGLVKTAVELYISYKASQLSILHEEPHLNEEICRRIRNKANGTFLWVAIVFKSFESMGYYDDNSKLLKMLDEMPEDLTRLYASMLERIYLLKGESSKLCRTALAIAILVYRPLHLNELSTLAGFQSRLKNLSRIEELIKDCGSFLTVQDSKIYFIHQSAKDYLTSDISSESFIFPDKRDKVHYNIISNSLDAMSQILRENIYKLEHPGILIDDVCPPNDNPLDSVLYSCANWVAHLCEIDTQSHLDGLIDKEKILGFLKTHFLHWLEALSLTRNLATNTSYVKRLNKLLKNTTENELQKFVYDASRFMQYHSQIIDTTPMQIYSSAVLFSPTESLVRSNFIGKLSSWITSTPAKDSHWSPCLQIIETKDPVAVDYRDMTLLIFNHNAEDVEIWDTALGQRIHVLNHTEIVCDAVFSSDSKHVLTVTSSQLMFWDITSGALTRSIKIIGLHDILWAYKISKDGKFLAAYLADDSSIQIYNIVEATSFQLPLHAIKGLGDIKWSNDSKLLNIDSFTFASLWDVARGVPKMKFDREYSKLPTRLSISDDSKLIAFIDETSIGIVIWDLDRDEKVSMVVPDNDPKEITSIQFSHDSTLLAMANGPVIEIRDIATGQRQHNLNFGMKRIKQLTWSTDSKALAVIFRNSVEIYDLTESRYWDSIVHDIHRPNGITFSADSTLVAAGGELLKIWDSTTGGEIRTIHRPRGYIFDHLQFSQNSKRIYTRGRNYDLRIWDIASGSLVPCPSTGREIRAAFSFDGKYFALLKQEIQLWSLDTNEMVSLSITPKAKVIHLALSDHAVCLVLVSEAPSEDDYVLPEIYIEVWSVAAEKKLWTVKDRELLGKKYISKRCGACGGYGRQYQASSVAISDDGTVLYITPSRHEMIIWSKGKNILQLPICSQYFQPYFDTQSQYILTQVGHIHLDKLIALAAGSSPSKTPFDYQSITEGYGLSFNGSWITWNGKNILWLPLDYRPASQRAISRHCIVIETVTAHICIISFSGPPPFASSS